VSDALITLHWLKIPERIIFKLAVFIHWSLHGAAPEYLAWTTVRVEYSYSTDERQGRKQRGERRGRVSQILGQGMAMGDVTTRFLSQMTINYTLL
jgi:hypothetical protein